MSADDLGETHDRESFGDEKEQEALEVVRQLFTDNPTRIFFTRQIEVRFEDTFYHWITNRAIHRLYEEEGILQREQTILNSGTPITLWWNRRNRYPKRSAKAVVDLVNEYSAPDILEHLGLQGEQMVQAGFARIRFLLLGEAVNEINGKKWVLGNHDLDFAFERDGIGYGVEVKNTLGYIRYGELQLKTALAKALGLTPLFVVRMMPKSWIWEVKQAGGFVLVLKYQLYPWTERRLAMRIREQLGLPVDSPKRLYEATMKRVLDWHNGRL